MPRTSKQPREIRPFESTVPGGPRVAFPARSASLSQDEEWFLVEQDGEWRRIGMHDYAAVFEVPGLYEQVVYDVLRCRSPRTVRGLLERAWRAAGCDPAELSFLDLGAGNGCVAEELAAAGVRRLVGADLLPEAERAARRDRPGLYADYVVGDVTELPPAERERLDAWSFDGLACVAALGFGDIPPEAFTAAFDRVRDGGWVAFTLKSEFLAQGDGSGFARLIADLVAEGVLSVVEREEYVHRLSLSGEPLRYTALVGRKTSDVPRR